MPMLLSRYTACPDLLGILTYSEYTLLYQNILIYARCFQHCIRFILTVQSLRRRQKNNCIFFRIVL